MNGSSILLSVNIGTEEAPNFEVIPCQTSLDLSISIGEIDQSCKDSAVNQYEPGAIDITATVAVMLTAWPGVGGPTSAHKRLVTWALTQQVFDAQVEVAGEAMDGMQAFITNANIAAPREDSSTLDIDLRITGIPTPVES